MRILTGVYRSRIIDMPGAIRPTQQKVRKAVFDVLARRIKGALFLELFAGSGAVGIEALSNGAKEVVFVEKDRDCLRVLKNNLLRLGAKNYCIKPADAFIAVEDLADAGRSFDLIFLDPPYNRVPRPRPDAKIYSNKAVLGQFAQMSLARKILIKIADCVIVKPCGFVVVQHHIKDALPNSFVDLKLYKRYTYANNILSFYGRQ
jgi:16S rRNA G966 N2-methylase RsmD